MFRSLIVPSLSKADAYALHDVRVQMLVARAAEGDPASNGTPDPWGTWDLGRLR